jgi:hypothetical protein
MGSTRMRWQHGKRHQGLGRDLDEAGSKTLPRTKHLLDAALADSLQLVYAQPSIRRPRLAAQPERNS